MATAPVSRSLSNTALEPQLESRGAENVLALQHPEPQTQLLVLSRNHDIIEVVRNSVRQVAQVAHAHDVEDMALSLPHIDPGVLILDESNTSDLPATITQLNRQFPDAVIVIVGTREKSNELMQLTAAGRIFRFLLMLLSYGQVRLALTAAVTQHLERKVASRRLGNAQGGNAKGGGRALVYVGVAAGLLVVFGGLWAASTILAAKPAAGTGTAATPRPSLIPGKPDPIMAQLARAADAMSQGRYVESTGESALELFRSALRVDPQNATARQGIRAIADEFLQRAEQALVAESLEDAQQALALVRDIESGHPRLAFLDTQLERERERLSLNQRRDVGNRVRKLLVDARSEMLTGNLIGTGSGGAVAGYIEARRLDPDDPSVIQGVRELNVALADAVRLALNAGDLQRARAFANASRRLGAGEQLVAAVERSLAESRRSAATASLSPVASAIPPTPAIDRAPSVVEERPPSKVDPGPGGTVRLDEILQAADLPRTKQVMPTYPRDAARDGTEGYVDLDFVIATDGVPRDIKVRSATPRRVFESAAMNCVRQWRFQPIVENGAPVARSATLRVRFELR